MEDKIEQLKISLRENRIKYGVDYSITYKYGELRILCNAIWQDTIKEEVKEIGLIVAEWFVYNKIRSSGLTSMINNTRGKLDESMQELRDWEKTLYEFHKEVISENVCNGGGEAMGRVRCEFAYKNLNVLMNRIRSLKLGLKRMEK